jgi:hypothetical protein
LPRRSATARITLIIASLVAFALPRAALAGVSLEDPPLAAVTRLFDAYERRDLEEYARYLAPDFLYFSRAAADLGDPRGRFAREDELRSAAHLFYGCTDLEGVARPAAELIRVVRGAPLLETPEPGVRAIVRVPHVWLDITFADGRTLQTEPTTQLFELVRFALSPDRGGAEWRVRRWFESSPEVPITVAAPTTPAKRDSVAAPPGASTEPLVRFGVLAHANPVRRGATISFGFPGAEPPRVSIVDVMGRVMARREWPAGRPLVRTLSVDELRLAPGVYWAAITQGDRRASAKLVLVR